MLIRHTTSHDLFTTARRSFLSWPDIKPAMTISANHSGQSILGPPVIDFVFKHGLLLSGYCPVHASLDLAAGALSSGVVVYKHIGRQTRHIESECPQKLGTEIMGLKLVENIIFHKSSVQKS